MKILNHHHCYSFHKKVVDYVIYMFKTLLKQTTNVTMTMKNIIRAFLFYSIATTSFYANAAVKGEIDFVLTAPFSADILYVVVKPEWTGSGCGTASTSSSVAVAFLPTNTSTYEPFDHNFNMVLAAALNGQTVTLHNSTSACNSFYAVTVHKD